MAAIEVRDPRGAGLLAAFPAMGILLAFTAVLTALARLFRWEST